jgi:hypothetical protein
MNVQREEKKVNGIHSNILCITVELMQKRRENARKKSKRTAVRVMNHIQTNLYQVGMEEKLSEKREEITSQRPRTGKIDRGLPVGEPNLEVLSRSPKGNLATQ